jgi:hypothetical protein|tara:strand:- start:381 stop:665 length:285 start_codon:yes stop_codon:yes gene_type:complete
MQIITKTEQIKTVLAEHLLGKTFPVAIVCYANDGVYVEANETINKEHLEKLTKHIDVWRFDYEDWNNFNEDVYRTESNIAKSLAKRISDKMVLA